MINAALVYPHSSQDFSALSLYETTHKCQVLADDVFIVVVVPIRSSGSGQAHVNGDGGGGACIA